MTTQSLPANITALAAAITAATDREDWGAVGEHLARLNQSLQAAKPASSSAMPVFSKADLQSALERLQEALSQATSRRDEIGHLLTALGK